jgi:rhodanese-related sulfurtransferase
MHQEIFMTQLLRIVALSLALIAAPAWSAESMTPAKLAEQMQAGSAPLILDVRTEQEFLDGHIPGARLIPHDKLGNYMDSLSDHKDAPVLVYCGTGKRAGKAAQQLEEAGFEQVLTLEGNFPGWNNGDRKVEP